MCVIKARVSLVEIISDSSPVEKWHFELNRIVLSYKKSMHFVLNSFIRTLRDLSHSYSIVISHHTKKFLGGDFLHKYFARFV